MRTAISLLRKRIPHSGIVPTTLALSVWTLLWVAPCAAQPAVNAQPGNVGNALIAPGGQQNGVLFGGPNSGNNTGRQGASANADFESLIELIQSTVSVETWAENGGGEAEARPFPTGVMVDAAGTLRLRSTSKSTSALEAKRGTAPVATNEPKLRAPSSTTADAHRKSSLRYVSLPRLEREIARRQAAHEPLDPAMLTLAGLQRLRYVFTYPETGDLVLAGPAGDWKLDGEGRIVSADTNEPVVRLDDLLVILRRSAGSADSHFGCSINPRQEALAKTQAFLASSQAEPLQPGQRKKWLGELRDTVGRQDIEFFGIESASRVASVLVEADYHMKLIGMGLVEGVDGVESYLDSVKLINGAPSPMSVLRWWFALNYDAIESSPAGNAFELVGQGVRVLSENELLAEQGQRVHTGQSDPLNRQFAENFTAHFKDLAIKYPVYGELRNIFDLAMAVALIEHEVLAQRVGWQSTLFASNEKLRLPRWPVPREVETVINHRMIDRRHFVAGVSGGVIVEAGDVWRDARTASQSPAKMRGTAPADVAAGVWWWDTE